MLQRDALGSLLRRYGSIERLDLFSCTGLDDVALAASVADGGAPMLRQIRLRRASGVGWRGLAAMVAACPKLETVDLSHCVGVGDREAAALAGLPGLKELKLDKCLKVTDVGLAKVAVGCPGLERLGIKWCLEISDVGIELLVKKCRELKELDISYLKVCDFFVRSDCLFDVLNWRKVLFLVIFLLCFSTRDLRNNRKPSGICLYSCKISCFFR